MATGVVPRGHWRGATHHADCWGEGEGGGEECDVSELYDHLEVVLRVAVSGAVRGAWRGGSGSGEGKEVAVRRRKWLGRGRRLPGEEEGILANEARE